MDGDEGVNGEVILSLADSTNFNINQTTGEISTVQVFDYETLSSFTVTITARGECPLDVARVGVVC